MPAFAELPVEERESRAVRLLDDALQAKAHAQEAAQLPPAPPPRPTAAAAAAASTAPPARAPSAAVQALEELRPGSNVGFLEHVLIDICKGDAAAAAAWLFESADVDAAERAYAARRGGKASRTPEEQAALRALILNRYDLVKAGSGGGGSGSAAAPWGAGREAEANAPKVRFHNGQVVSTRGEKYVTEKLQPEWDGGSRGRVKTKGKRGPGFV